MMSNDKLTVVKPQGASSIDRAQLELLKKTICAGSSDDEFALFVATSQRLGLDPFARQIFAVRRWDSRVRAEVMSIQVSIDGFRLVAERTGSYTPGRPTEFEMAGRLPMRATAFVKKFSHGGWHEVGEDAYYDEYVQTNKEGKPNAMWSRMPRVMLAKCAEARALRRAFPAELSGVYAPEEMGQAANEAAVDAEVIEEPPALSADELEGWETKLKLAASISTDKLSALIKDEMSGMTEPQRRLLRPAVNAAKSNASRLAAERIKQGRPSSGDVPAGGGGEAT
jgi:phage recombination protein Bet